MNLSWLPSHLEHRQLAYRLVASALVFAISLGIGYYSYRDVVFTTDENSYLFQASTFGKLALRQTPPPQPLELLLSGGMNVIDPKLGWFSRYPPGHALWLLPGVLVGAPRLMSALAAALSMWLLTGVARVLRVPWWSAALFLLLSPYFLFMHGTLLSHTSSLLAVSLMLWAYLLWRNGPGTHHIAIAGAAWAFLYLARPYTAALLVPAFALDGILILFRRRDRPTLLALIWFGGTALLGPLLMLWYNYAVTGAALLTPYLLYDPSAALGFNGPSGHTLKIGLNHLQKNLHLLDAWLLGTPWTLVALALCFLACASTSLAWLAGIATGSIMGGYILFYYPGFNTCGPYYYFEALPFLVLIWLLCLQRVHHLRHATLAHVFLFVLVAYVARSSLSFTLHQAATFRNRTSREAALQATLRRAPANSIVAVLSEQFVPGDDLRTRLQPNPHGLDSDPLVIESLKDYDSIITSFFPNRQLLRLRNTQPPRLEPFRNAKFVYALHIPASSTHRLTGHSNGARDEATWCRTASTGDAPGMLGFGRSAIAPSGPLKAIFDLSISNVPADCPVILDVSTHLGRNILATNVVWGNLGRLKVEVPFQLPTAANIEPRIYYSGAGAVSFWSVSLEEATASPDSESPPIVEEITAPNLYTDP